MSRATVAAPWLPVVEQPALSPSPCHQAFRQLTAMGFPEADVVAALQLTHNDFAAAVGVNFLSFLLPFSKLVLLLPAWHTVHSSAVAQRRSAARLHFQCELLLQGADVQAELREQEKRTADTETPLVTEILKDPLVQDVLRLPRMLQGETCSPMLFASSLFHVASKHSLTKCCGGPFLPHPRPVLDLVSQDIKKVQALLSDPQLGSALIRIVKVCHDARECCISAFCHAHAHRKSRPDCPGVRTCRRR